MNTPSQFTNGKYYIEDNPEIFFRVEFNLLTPPGKENSIIEKGLIRCQSDDLDEIWFTRNNHNEIRMGIPVFLRSKSPKTPASIKSITVHAIAGSLVSTSCYEDSIHQDQDNSIIFQIKDKFQSVNPNNDDDGDGDEMTEVDISQFQEQVESKLSILYDLLIRKSF
ncbi:uncharacterized protein L201_007509 [Kwoniella dendrophila CBS 6074]|uniref:Uncharacterized protein n=1 Tax=Kwoniella dendrophila CBS 6074 TaxID=1295534 RepID=A0AAX4K6V5_9TREE